MTEAGFGDIDRGATTAPTAGKTSTFGIHFGIYVGSREMDVLFGSISTNLGQSRLRMWTPGAEAARLATRPFVPAVGDIESMTEQEGYYSDPRSCQTTSVLKVAHRAKPYSVSLRSLSPALCRQNGGFALIIVLWTLVLIAFIVAQTTANGRIEIRIASNLIANAVEEAAADGAIYEAIFILSNPEPNQRWPVDGSKRELVIGHTRVTVQLEDEAWWINPNWASPALLEALLRATGTDPDNARHLADAVTEWVGSAPAPRVPNVILADYRAAGLDYGPPGAPLETLDELGRVISMTPATLAAIRPHLTLFGPAQPSAATPDPAVAAALAAAAQATTASPALQPPPDMLTTRITATAIGATRSAVVRIGAMLPGGYQILAWGDHYGE